VIYIPMASEWDCLNVAASAAVLLAEVAARQRST
jgi:tRNA G18 (ribose-2'-O)-methylase SpoU